MMAPPFAYRAAARRRARHFSRYRIERKCSRAVRFHAAREHGFQAETSVTRPAPTVLPPSRMAKRTPFSMPIDLFS